MGGGIPSAKFDLNAAATTSDWPLGAAASRFRVYGTRHRCHEDPEKHLRIDFFKPTCTSAVTNLTPPKPSCFNEHRNWVQKLASSESPISTPIAVIRLPTARVDLNLHHQHVHGLIHTAVRFQHRRKERSLVEFWDLQRQIAGDSGQNPGSVTVTVPYSANRAFPPVRTNAFSGLSLDQFLHPQRAHPPLFE